MNDLVMLMLQWLDVEVYMIVEIISQYVEIGLRIVNNRINQYKDDLMEFGMLRFSMINV